MKFENSKAFFHLMSFSSVFDEAFTAAPGKLLATFEALQDPSAALPAPSGTLTITFEFLRAPLQALRTPFKGFIAPSQVLSALSESPPR